MTIWDRLSYNMGSIKLEIRIIANRAALATLSQLLKVIDVVETCFLGPATNQDPQHQIEVEEDQSKEEVATHDLKETPPMKETT